MSGQQRLRSKSRDRTVAAALPRRRSHRMPLPPPCRSPLPPHAAATALPLAIAARFNKPGFGETNSAPPACMMQGGDFNDRSAALRAIHETGARHMGERLFTVLPLRIRAAPPTRKMSCRTFSSACSKAPSHSRMKSTRKHGFYTLRRTAARNTIEAHGSGASSFLRTWVRSQIAPLTTPTSKRSSSIPFGLRSPIYPTNSE